MPLQILLNLLIAIVWMFFHDEWSVPTFTVGYLIGLALIFAMRRFFPSAFYGKKVVAVINLLLIFIRELVKSGYNVTKQVIRPKLNVTPGIFRTETPLTSDWELTILCCLITLTPGSVVVEIAPKEGVLYIHTMDIPDDEIGVNKMKAIFEKAIMGVTR